MVRFVFKVLLPFNVKAFFPVICRASTSRPVRSKEVKASKLFKIQLFKCIPLNWASKEISCNFFSPMSEHCDPMDFNTGKASIEVTSFKLLRLIEPPIEVRASNPFNSLTAKPDRVKLPPTVVRFGKPSKTVNALIEEKSNFPSTSFNALNELTSVIAILVKTKSPFTRVNAGKFNSCILSDASILNPRRPTSVKDSKLTFSKF